MKYLLAVGALALTSLAGSAFAFSSAALKGFQTPSHNIVCGGYNGSSAWLRCDITSGLKPKPGRPKGCEFDFGGTLTLSTVGDGPQAECIMPQFHCQDIVDGPGVR